MGGTLHVWRHDPGSLPAQAGARATATPSHQEWERFLGPSRPLPSDLPDLPEGQG